MGAIAFVALALNPSSKALAESLRQVIGDFVRSTRSQAGTPSTAQSETLGILQRDGAMSVADLSGRRQVRHQSMRLVVAQLENESLVARLANPLDGRSQLVELTPAGRALLQASRNARSRHIEAAIASELTADERQRLQDGIGLLRRLLKSAGG